jgi:hypothetical protein
MKIKEQWIVEYNDDYTLLTLTENNGYFLGYQTDRYCFFEATTRLAKELISKMELKQVNSAQ